MYDATTNPVSPIGQACEGTESLAAVSGAYRDLAAARDAVARAQSVLVETIRDARDDGQRLADIAGAIGVTRQYVQKVLREAAKGEAEWEAYQRSIVAGADADIRKDHEGIGRTHCRCGCFKSRPSAVCSQCGDDPVTHNGSALEYDEAHYGRRVI